MILTFPCGPLATNAYLVACDSTKKALAVDVPFESVEVLKKGIEEHGLHLEKIVLTHSHWDHFGDLTPFHRLFPVPVCVHADDAYNLEMPGADNIPLPFKLDSFSPDLTFYGGEHIKVGELDFEVIHTPGHTPGGICLYEEKKKWLFSGDTLFKRTIGILSIPTGDEASMWNSLKKLEALPKDVSVYPGHGPSTTLGEETWLPDAEKLFGKNKI